MQLNLLDSSMVSLFRESKYISSTGIRTTNKVQ